MQKANKTNKATTTKNAKGSAATLLQSRINLSTRSTPKSKTAHNIQLLQELIFFGVLPRGQEVTTSLIKSASFGGLAVRDLIAVSQDKERKYRLEVIEPRPCDIIDAEKKGGRLNWNEDEKHLHAIWLSLNHAVLQELRKCFGQMAKDGSLESPKATKKNGEKGKRINKEQEERLLTREFIDKKNCYLGRGELRPVISQVDSVLADETRQGNHPVPTNKEWMRALDYTPSF